MKVTKSDIADVSLVWIAFHFVPYLFNYAIYAIFEILRVNPYAGLPMGAAPVYSRIYSVFIAFGQFGVIAAFFWFLLFKRNLILDLLFPGSEDKALELSGDSTEKLTDYSFWITIFGLFTAIHSGIKCLSGIPRCIDKSISVFFLNVWHNESVDILAFVFAVAVIWKAKSIASMLNRTKTIDAAKTNQ
jgi:hypothetical protein